MKNKTTRATKTISILLAGLILFTTCASTTMIKSTPSGVNVYLNSKSVGKNPYMHTYTKMVASCMTVRLEKEGYESFRTSYMS